jgi:metal-dependent amidase/aminoacylase/carboxypeptidase family protein
MFHLIALANNSLSILGEFKHEVVITMMVTGFLAAVSYPFRQAKAKWEAMTGKLDAVHQELTLQRSNCLTTLQAQGTEQVNLLKKTVEVLGEIRMDNREMITHLRDKF